MHKYLGSIPSTATKKTYKVYFLSIPVIPAWCSGWRVSIFAQTAGMGSNVYPQYRAMLRFWGYCHLCHCQSWLSPGCFLSALQCLDCPRCAHLGQAARPTASCICLHLAFLLLMPHWSSFTKHKFKHKIIKSFKMATAKQYTKHKLLLRASPVQLNKLYTQ